MLLDLETDINENRQLKLNVLLAMPNNISFVAGVCTHWHMLTKYAHAQACVAWEEDWSEVTTGYKKTKENQRGKLWKCTAGTKQNDESELDA